MFKGNCKLLKFALLLQMTVHFVMSLSFMRSCKDTIQIPFLHLRIVTTPLLDTVWLLFTAELSTKLLLLTPVSCDIMVPSQELKGLNCLPKSWYFSDDLRSCADVLISAGFMPKTNEIKMMVLGMSLSSSHT